MRSSTWRSSRSPPRRVAPKVRKRVLLDESHPIQHHASQESVMTASVPNHNEVLLPTPDELMEAPELGTLSALEAVLKASISSLWAAHPDLGDPEPAPDQTRGSLAPLWLADTIIDQARALEASLHRYRVAVHRPLRPSSVASLDDDFPF